MKLLLIDDHALFRDGLSLLMAHTLSLSDGQALQVLEAGALSEAERVLREHPDVRLVLLDLGLPDQQGMGTLARWREAAPHIPVVVLSADDRLETIVSAIDGGAAGFIPKSAQARIMQEALSHVLAGGVYLPPLGGAAVREGSAHWLDEDDAADPLQVLGLSARQLDVLRLLIEGKPNKEICRLLALSESTVKTHLAAIFRKLRVNSRTQAVVAVAQAGVSLAVPASGA
jgi:DNA-binding NarL/FixJ family response regulator